MNGLGLGLGVGVLGGGSVLFPVKKRVTSSDRRHKNSSVSSRRTGDDDDVKIIEEGETMCEGVKPSRVTDALSRRRCCCNFSHQRFSLL